MKLINQHQGKILLFGKSLNGNLNDGKIRFVSRKLVTVLRVVQSTRNFLSTETASVSNHRTDFSTILSALQYISKSRKVVLKFDSVCCREIDGGVVQIALMVYSFVQNFYH